MPAPTLIYWVMFERDVRPEKVHARSWLELVDALSRLAAERGPLEWMQRGYR